MTHQETDRTLDLGVISFACAGTAKGAAVTDDLAAVVDSFAALIAQNP